MRRMNHSSFPWAGERVNGPGGGGCGDREPPKTSHVKYEPFLAVQTFSSFTSVLETDVRVFPYDKPLTLPCVTLFCLSSPLLVTSVFPNG